MNRSVCTFLLTALAVIGSSWAQDRTVTVQVPATQSWTKTGVYVNPGASVRIEASGFIDAVPPNDNRPQFKRVPPDGRPQRQDNKPQPEMPTLVMLARFGGGPVLQAGSRAELFANDRNGSGELQLGINDDYVADNAGAWTARITLIDSGGALSSRDRNGRYTDYSTRRDSSGSYRADGRSQADLPSTRRSGDSRDAADEIDSKARQLGTRALGGAVSEIQRTGDGFGYYRQYQDGAIYWSPETGAHAVMGPIREAWLNRGAEIGELGYPVSDEEPARNGLGRRVRFEHGSIVWNERTGARVERD